MADDHPEGSSEEHDMFVRFLVALPSWDESGPLTASDQDEENITRKIDTYRLPEQGYSIDGTKLTAYPPLESIREIIGLICEPFEKQLTKSDVNKGMGRLLLNRPFVESKYMDMIAGEDLKRGTKVKVYGPNGKEFELEFKLWAEKLYVLTHRWNDFWLKYGLCPHQYWLRIWMFRHKRSGQLCFALTWKFMKETTELIKGRGG